MRSYSLCSWKWPGRLKGPAKERIKNKSSHPLNCTLHYVQDRTKTKTCLKKIKSKRLHLGKNLQLPGIELPTIELPPCGSFLSLPGGGKLSLLWCLPLYIDQLVLLGYSQDVSWTACWGFCATRCFLVITTSVVCVACNMCFLKSVLELTECVACCMSQATHVSWAVCSGFGAIDCVSWGWLSVLCVSQATHVSLTACWRCCATRCVSWRLLSVCVCVCVCWFQK